MICSVPFLSPFIEAEEKWIGLDHSDRPIVPANLRNELVEY